MKIRSVRARVFQWKGKTVPPQGNFCSNAMDLLYAPQETMSTFRFHAWTVVEVETDDGIVGLGNVALAPHVAKVIIDQYLAPLVIGQDWIERVQSGMPELPAAIQQRFVDEYGVSAYDAGVLTSSKAMAAYFEAVVAKAGAANAKIAANWLMGDVSSQLNRDGIEIDAIPVSAAQLALVLQRIADGTISNKIAKEIFTTIWDEKADDEGAADRIIDAKGLKQISDTGALEAIIDEVLAANAKSVEEFRAGKEKAFNALIGQAMKATKGKANPQQVNELLKKKLG